MDKRRVRTRASSKTTMLPRSMREATFDKLARSDKELSTRNFNDYLLMEVHAPARLRQRIAEPRGCLRVPGQGRP